MTRPKAHLPDYYPVGSRYVVEGRSDAKGALKVSARYVVFPDGRRIDLPLAAAAPLVTPRQRLSRRLRPVATAKSSRAKRPRTQNRVGA